MSIRYNIISSFIFPKRRTGTTSTNGSTSETEQKTEASTSSDEQNSSDETTTSSAESIRLEKIKKQSWLLVEEEGDESEEKVKEQRSGIQHQSWLLVG